MYQDQQELADGANSRLLAQLVPLARLKVIGIGVNVAAYHRVLEFLAVAGITLK